MGRLTGKVGFVTGAGGGIGRSICARFIAEGARVVATDIDLALARETVAEARGGNAAIAIACDVGESGSVRSAIQEAVAAFGKIDTLCNVAGGSTAQDARVTEAPEKEFWRAIRLDLFGTFLCCKHGIPEIIKAGGGAVINMASVVALMALPGRDCYTAAKGGVASLTRSMAVEYAPDRIRINAIAPSLTLTPRVRGLLAENENLKRLASLHLLGPGEPIDIAHMAVYLASDESRIVTGQILSVDSGVTIY